MDIGGNIRKIRELKGYSQEYISGKLEISQRQLSRIENNDVGVSVHRLREISAILEVTPIQLLGFDEKHIFQNCTNNEIENNHNNHLSSFDKERELYEKRIAELQEELSFLKKQFEKLLDKK